MDKTLNLTKEEWELIVEGLLELPAKRTFTLLKKLDEHFSQSSLEGQQSKEVQGHPDEEK